MIPLVDLQAQYITYAEEIDSAIKNVITKGQFIGGEEVDTFENKFASYLGSGEFISCANGTDSMEMILEAWDIGLGDEVLVPALSWISTSEVVIRSGAKPIFVDIDEESKCIDPDLAYLKITERTKAIIVVHLYGQSADMAAIMKIASDHDLLVLEDCAQSHGTMFHERKVGTFGHAASYSFYPGKTLGCYGDGGGIYTTSMETADRIRMIKNHGQKIKHQHLIHGRNSRLDNIQAAILNVKLKYLDQWIVKKNKVAERYYNHLKRSNNMQLPVIVDGIRHSWHLFVLNHDRRDELKSYLYENNIQSAIHYPATLPSQPCYNDDTVYDISSHHVKTCLSIPMFAEMTFEDIDFISHMINTFNA